MKNALIIGINYQDGQSISKPITINSKKSLINQMKKFFKDGADEILLINKELIVLSVFPESVDLENIDISDWF